MRSHNRGQLVFWVVAAVVAFVLLLLIIVGPANKREGLLGFVLDEVSLPVRKGVQSVGDSLEGVWKRYVFLIGLTAENEALKQELALTRQELITYKEKDKELQRLYKLLALKELEKRRYTGARVIAKVLTPTARTITIDKGLTAEIRPGMPVINAEGIVGRVLEASWHSAQVLLITDLRSNVDVVLQESRVTGVLQGLSSTRCQIKYIPLGENIREGELVLSSGLDGVFPKGIVLGRVCSVEKQRSGLSQHIELIPAVDFSKLEEIIVLTGESGK